LHFLNMGSVVVIDAVENGKARGDRKWISKYEVFDQSRNLKTYTHFEGDN